MASRNTKRKYNQVLSDLEDDLDDVPGFIKGQSEGLLVVAQFEAVCDKAVQGLRARMRGMLTSKYMDFMKSSLIVCL